MKLAFWSHAFVRGFVAQPLWTKGGGMGARAQDLFCEWELLGGALPARLHPTQVHTLTLP